MQCSTTALAWSTNLSGPTTVAIVATASRSIFPCVHVSISYAWIDNARFFLFLVEKQERCVSLFAQLFTRRVSLWNAIIVVYRNMRWVNSFDLRKVVESFARPRVLDACRCGYSFIDNMPMIDVRIIARYFATLQHHCIAQAHRIICRASSLSYIRPHLRFESFMSIRGLNVVCEAGLSYCIETCESKRACTTDVIDWRSYARGMIMNKRRAFEVSVFEFA